MAQARDRDARLEADRRGRHFQAHPGARQGQVAHAHAFGRAVLAEVDEVLAPVRPMLPAVGVELEHQLLGRVDRVEEDMGEQDVALADLQGLRGLGELLLGQVRRRWSGGWRTAPLLTG